MANKTFSIITVSFNSAQTIEKTILSVLNQTYRNFEYIIIDGGSTDGTVDIIKKYHDKISYWVSEKDRGISDAFNKGITVSHGTIVGIVNSDDWYESNTLQTVAELAAKNDADFYIGALRYWDSDSKTHISYPDKNYQRTISFRMPHVNHPASFFRRNVYEEVGLFNTQYKYAMDYDLFLRAQVHCKKAYFTDAVLSNMHVGGAANQYAGKAYKEVLQIAHNKFLGFIWYVLSLTRMHLKNLLT